MPARDRHLRRPGEPPAEGADPERRPALPGTRLGTALTPLLPAWDRRRPLLHPGHRAESGSAAAHREGER